MRIARGTSHRPPSRHPARAGGGGTPARGVPVGPARAMLVTARLCGCLVRRVVSGTTAGRTFGTGAQLRPLLRIALGLLVVEGAVVEVVVRCDGRPVAAGLRWIDVTVDDPATFVEALGEARGGGAAPGRGAWNGG